MAWFETWFNTSYYHILYKDRDFAEAELFISKLTDFLQLPQHSKIIDLACGKGRHSIYLNKLGYSVLGLDLSKESIFHNKQLETSSPQKSTNLKFEVHDMRNEIFPNISKEKVDAVFNLFTSFGYFENPKDDEKVFQSVYNCLNIEGFFVLDFLNENFVEKNLVPNYQIEKEGILFNISKKIEDHHIIKEINFDDKGESFQFIERVKLHTLEEIEGLAKKVGFEKVKVFGDYFLNDFDLEKSPRCINIFRKK